MQSITNPSYSIHFNDFAYEALNLHLEKSHYSTLFILVDENTFEYCLPNFMAEIVGDYHFEVIEIVPGEAHKNIETCAQVWGALSDLEADRKSLLVNLGGGVITDLGGFVASTFKRGIDFINVPTTLLSMVDASVGGKTGVDLGPLKNQIGVINQPVIVLIISDFLKTLEERQLQSGFAEMLKHGLIRDKEYWATLRSVNDLGTVDSLIYDSVVLKNQVTLQDPTEQNQRKSLNFGHTLGHAIESYFLDSESHQTLLHGEAIAVGMVLEAFLSQKLTGLSQMELDEVKNTFTSRYPKVDFSDDDIYNILGLLKFDKKNSHGNINFVLLKSIGETVLDVKVPQELYFAAFSYYKE